MLPSYCSDFYSDGFNMHHRAREHELVPESCFIWALIQQDRNPPHSSSISQGATNHPCPHVSSGALIIPALHGQGEQGLIAAGSGGTGGHWGALVAFPFSRARDPIPGTAQTLLAALPWAQQGAELCLCVFQSELSGDKRDRG